MQGGRSRTPQSLPYMQIIPSRSGDRAGAVTGPGDPTSRPPISEPSPHIRRTFDPDLGRQQVGAASTARRLRSWQWPRESTRSYPAFPACAWRP